MDLREAYRVLEIAPGATRDQAREARNVLAKVWHPDKHHGDPKLQERAAEKLRQVNDAYKSLETAGFPPAAREAPPAYVDSIKPRPSPTPPKPVKADIEFVPRRRVRMWVPFVFGLAVAGGIALYLRPGSEAAPAAPAPAPEPVVKSDPPKPAPPKPDPDPGLTGPVPTSPNPSLQGSDDNPGSAGSADHFTIGSTRDEVRRVMGTPTRIDDVFERYYYGTAYVEFRDDKVRGWTAMGFDKLKTTLAPKDPAVAAAAKAHGTYTEHATRDEVLGVEGPPETIERDFGFGERWYYSMSFVSFDTSGHINEIWRTPTHKLKLE